MYHCLPFTSWAQIYLGNRLNRTVPERAKKTPISNRIINQIILLLPQKFYRVKIINPVFWKRIAAGDRYKMKIRYLSPFYDVEIADVSKKSVQARCLQPVKSVTPGQTAVFYQNNIIVAAGSIG